MDTGRRAQVRRSLGASAKVAFFWIGEMAVTIVVAGYAQAIFFAFLIVLTGRIDRLVTAGGWGLAGFLALIGGALGELAARALHLASTPWWRFSGPIAVVLVILLGFGGRPDVGPTLCAALYLLGQFAAVMILRSQAGGDSRQFTV